MHDWVSFFLVFFPTSVRQILTMVLFLPFAGWKNLSGFELN